MTDLQPVQQKPESTTNDARVDFEGGWVELIRGPLDECTSFASCSSTRTPDNEDEEGDHLVRRRRRSDLEGDDLAESSAARRRHSRILSRWAARQAQEMITTIERRNRESELMALARLHTVSMLDSSFLRESQSPPPTSRRQGAAELPSTRASAILQMWRELEDEHVLNRARERVRVRERLRQQRSVESTTTNVSSANVEARGSENQGSLAGASENDNRFGPWSPGQMGSPTQPGDNNDSVREQSPDLGEVDRERVRQIVRGWMGSGVSDHASNVPQRNGNARAEWLGETERERVRLVREWVQMTSQQCGARGGRRADQGGGRDVQVTRGRERSVTDHDEVQPEQTRTDMLRLRGRQAVIDLLMRIERDRQGELQGLLEHRAVSEFAHRNRIQSLLRGRFLRNDRIAEDERPPSVAASELLHLRQRHTVSGIREGFHSRSENIVHGQVSSQSYTSIDHDNNSRNGQTQTYTSQGVQHEDNVESETRAQENEARSLPDQTDTSERNAAVDNINWQGNVNQARGWQEEITDNVGGNWQQSDYGPFNEWRDDSAEPMDQNWQHNSVDNWPPETPGDVHNEPGDLQEARGVWREDGSQEAVETWIEEPSDPPRAHRTVPSRRFSRFHPSDDENVYSMELRELVSRRSVSNLLRSGFRESLDQLIQSYAERQGRGPIDWDVHRNLPTLPEQDEEQQRDEHLRDQREAVNRPSPPVPPPQPLWHQDLHQTGWSRHSMHRSELEWETMNDLKADMARLQQGMSHMQKMVEACMDMQLELQRSVRQEVSAALNRSAGEKGPNAQTSEDGSKWGNVKKGTCCVCCDSHIDSLLYRCGHMCTCTKCANELVRGDGKCPLCRAPIVEVIRAYSIQ